MRAQPVVLERADGLLGLGIKPAHGNAELGAGLEDPDPRHAEREVLAVGGVDEPVEHRVVKCLPPGAVVDRLARQAFAARLAPIVEHCRVRPRVVRPQLRAPGGKNSQDHGKAGITMFIRIVLIIRSARASRNRRYDFSERT